MDSELVKKVMQLRLMDDIFFNRFMQDAPECMEYVLNVIMDRTDLKVESLEVQYDVPGVITRGVRFDAFCTDAEGRVYDFEVQNDSAGASPKRARLNGSILDVACSRRGATWETLPDVYVIMFCEHDEIGLGQPISIIKNQVQGTDKLFGDGKSIIYINGQYRDISTAIGRLIADFHCTEPSQMHSERLAKRAKQLKSTDGEVTDMCNIVEEYAAEKAAKSKLEGEAIGRFQNTIENVKQLMHNMNLTAEKALAAIGIPEGERQQYLAAL